MSNRFFLLTGLAAMLGTLILGVFNPSLMNFFMVWLIIVFMASLWGVYLLAYFLLYKGLDSKLPKQIFNKYAIFLTVAIIFGFTIYTILDTYK